VANATQPAIKARWACEQAHQQLKDELGLDHYEGRSWLGLHHHALLTMMAFGYLQHRRLASASQAEKNEHPIHRDRHRNLHCQRYAGPFSPRFGG
jgi:SRSO17 transposase